MMKHAKHAIFALLILFLISCTIPGILMAEGSYVGTSFKNNSGYNIFDFQIEDQSGNIISSVFCYDIDQVTPLDISGYNLGELPLYNEKNEIMEERNENIRKALWLAYPMDKGNFRNTYQLSEDEYRSITQYVVWAFQKGESDIPYQSGEKYNYYIPEILINKCNAIFNDIIKNQDEIPINFQLIFYEGPTHQYLDGPKRFQDLVWAQLLPLQVTFSKVAAGQTEELPGALLTVQREDGTTVDTWYSTDEPYVLALEVGQYTLIENQAPLGFDTAESITFQVNDDGKVYVLEDSGWVLAENALIQMTDQYTPEIPETPIHYLTFSKVAAGQTEELPGAILTLTNADRTVIYNWTTTETAKVIQLDPGEYTLREDRAPEGYELADNITFRLYADGSVQKKVGDSWFDMPSSKIQMEDHPITPLETPAPTVPSLANQAARLPKTGQNDMMLSYMGISLLAVGAMMLLRRKNR